MLPNSSVRGDAAEPDQLGLDLIRNLDSGLSIVSGQSVQQVAEQSSTVQGEASPESQDFWQHSPGPGQAHQVLFRKCGD